MRVRVVVGDTPSESEGVVVLVTVAVLERVGRAVEVSDGVFEGDAPPESEAVAVTVCVAGGVAEPVAVTVAEGMLLLKVVEELVGYPALEEGMLMGVLVGDGDGTLTTKAAISAALSARL